MKKIIIALVLLALAATSQAQYLRAGGYAQSGIVVNTAEKDWVSAVAGDTLTRSTEAFLGFGGTNASMSYTAGFGILRGNLRAEVNGTGPLYAAAGGSFVSSTNFVGATFMDTITLTGAGPETALTINYSLHSINEAPDATNTHADAQLKIDMISLAPSITTIGVPGLIYNGIGNVTSSGSFEIHGVPGNSFLLFVELSGLVSATLPDGVTGHHVASSDASHTALLSIAPVTGSFSAASGASYAALAPVPEPETYAMMLVGLGLLGVLARNRQAVS